MEKLFNNQIFLHSLSTTQQWKNERHETLPRCLFIDIRLCLKFSLVWFLFWNCHHRSPTYHPQTSANPPPPPTFPTGVARKQVLPLGKSREDTRRALSSFVINVVLSSRLLPGDLINWCPILYNVRSFWKYLSWYLPLLSSIFFRCWTWLSQKFQVIFLFCLVQHVVTRSLRTLVE